MHHADQRQRRRRQLVLRQHCVAVRAFGQRDGGDRCLAGDQFRRIFWPRQDPQSRYLAALAKLGLPAGDQRASAATAMGNMKRRGMIDKQLRFTHFNLNTSYCCERNSPCGAIA